MMPSHAPAAGALRQPPADTATVTTLDAALQALTEADWHASALLAWLPSLPGHAATLAPPDRVSWLIGLRRCWEQHHEAFDAAAKRALLTLAAAWACWPLALAVGASLTPDQRRDPAVLAPLGRACHLAGDIDAALDFAVTMQFADPGQHDHAATYRDLLAWRDWRRGSLPMHGIAHDDEPLYLEPLGHQHLADFRWQYYDPAIAEWCCLPRFDDDAAWHRWLDASYAQGDRQFAVMHRSWGFIGNVGLTQYRDMGFFYYWIGRDFQGHGFGSGAAALLLAAAHRHAGMRACYATVYDTNAASRRALEKIGFVDTGIRAVPPNGNQLFYRIGEPDAPARIASELHALTDRLELDVRAAVPLASSAS
ncbi:GNAT family N-acetyltransferase [Burkholderia plantarii]|uniref:GNAT family N-acetyltransferase n=1 Tax=Burkholderia plantarii TaxID=41899 RepID=UPI0008706BC6|nr:GNAT family N-acetyltransferase [Burkholderia plantarii]